MAIQQSAASAGVTPAQVGQMPVPGAYTGWTQGNGMPYDGMRPDMYTGPIQATPGPFSLPGQMNSAGYQGQQSGSYTGPVPGVGGVPMADQAYWQGGAIPPQQGMTGASGQGRSTAAVNTGKFQTGTYDGGYRGFVNTQPIPSGGKQQASSKKTRAFKDTNPQSNQYAQNFQNPQNHGNPQKPKKKHHGLRIIAVLLLLALLGTGGYFGAKSYQETKTINDKVEPYNNLFCPGVYVDGIPLGGMTPEQALNSVQSQIRQRNDAWKVTLTYEGEVKATINAGMLGMSVDIGEVMNQAWLQGHTGDNEQRYQQMTVLEISPYHGYTAVPSGDTTVIDSLLAQIKSEIDTPAVNAQMVSFDTTLSYPFVFSDESYGRRLDTEPIKEQLYHMVSEMESGEVELKPDSITPNVLKADLQLHYMLRSSAYTPISTKSSENRNNNIRRAFDFVNGYVVYPGENFSFNGVVGERTLARGFFTAEEYAYGEHVEGVGGGVCQASTTIYQAAVEAGLQIVKREPHSDAVTYTDYGRDATVYWVGKRKIDLVFRNNTEDPIYIVAAVEEDPSNKRRWIARVTLYGAYMGDVRYELTSAVIEELEPPEEPTYVKDKEGTYVTYTDQQKSVSKAKPGYVVQSYRLKYEGNVLTEQKELDKDIYKPQPEKIYVGVKSRGN